MNCSYTGKRIIGRYLHYKIVSVGVYLFVKNALYFIHTHFQATDEISLNNKAILGIRFFLGSFF